MQAHPYCAAYNIENCFTLFIQQNTCSSTIKMLLLKKPINTADFPYTFEILQNFLPGVLTNECFNDIGLPFHEEVKRTEIGHLFEHILLEYMCQLKIDKGHRQAVYAGRTKWNWQRDPRGVFHIHINCTLKDADIFPLALNKTIELMKIILQTQHQFLPFCKNLQLTQNTLKGLKNGKELKKINNKNSK